MADESRCVICEAYFRPNVMVGDKCKPCNEKYPKAHSREDVKIDNKNRAKTLTDVTVREMIYEVLEEAGLKRAKCEKCGKLYFKSSPAQKQCSDCAKKEGK